MNIKKNYLITLGLSVLIMFTIVIIVLMLMLPKQSTVVKGTISSYDQISKSQYTFDSTKDITSEPLTKQYSVTNEDMNSYKSTSQYTTGNNDPFAPLNNDGTTSNTTKSSTTNTTTNTTSTNSSASQDATNKTTNSNGGVANPSATSK